MSRRSFSHVKATREVAADDHAWGMAKELIISMMTLAKIADDADVAASAKTRAVEAWTGLYADVISRQAAAAREASWESRRPRAV